MTDTSTFSFAEANCIYEHQAAESGLYVVPAPERSTFERNAWMLRDEIGNLVAIVNREDVIFGGGIHIWLRRLVEGLH